MTITRRLLAVLVSAGAVIAMIVIGSGPAASEQDHARSELYRLRHILVPPGLQAEGSEVQRPITLRQAAEGGGFDTGGMTSSPASCLTFVEDAIGDLGALNGWLQVGTRARDKAIFVQMVAKVPEDFEVDRFRQAVASCEQGTVTLEGRITGDTTFEEQTPPDLESAETFITRMTSTFPAPADAEEEELLARYNFHEGACPSDYVFILVGDVLIWSLDPDADIALRAGTIMHSRALRVRV